MVRRNLLWRLGFALALFLLLYLASTSAAEEPRQVDLQSRLAFCWTLLHDNSIYADRLPDWEACQMEFGSPRTFVDEQSADEAAAKLFRTVHDQYTYFRNRERTDSFNNELEQQGVVSYSMKSNGEAYIKLRTFASRHAAEELRDTLMTLQSARRYVLDLRGNSGGLVQEAFQIYAMFVDEGVFCSFKGRMLGEDYSETLSVTRTRLKQCTQGLPTLHKRIPNLTAHKPLVILVDHDTRSAAELVAGALHDCGRARIVGTRTFGKGVVQDSWSLGDGSSVRITTGRSYLPKSGCIDGIGLQPDVAGLPDLSVVAAH